MSLTPITKTRRREIAIRGTRFEFVFGPDGIRLCHVGALPAAALEISWHLLDETRRKHLDQDIAVRPIIAQACDAVTEPDRTPA